MGAAALFPARNDQVSVSSMTNFAANVFAARDGICLVMTELAEQGLSGDMLGSVEIALAEAVNNVVEHAYAGLPPGEIEVAYELADRSLWLAVSDQGNGLPDHALPPGNPADLTVDRSDLPEGGFGWLLIRSVTREVTYERCNGVNRLSLWFDLDSAPV